MTEREERLAEALHKIVQWSEAYPLTAFHEPDWAKAKALLEAGGVSLDAISASCMRHVVGRIGRIAREALTEG
jgi:hypothetical protein